jgi:hypothetical protein
MNRKIPQMIHAKLCEIPSISVRLKMFSILVHSYTNFTTGG